jgi:protein-S-isoprenylcysteine O-methyltransferase Ste14
MIIWFRYADYYEIKRRGASILPIPLLVLAFFVVSFVFPLGWAFLPISVLGLIIFLCGFIAALWSKGTLGDNWSPGNEIRMGHELVTEVPYSLVRHPVYFCLIVMCAGTAFIFGSLTMLGATVVFGIILVARAYLEERALLEEFGQEYLQYQEEVPFILPQMFSCLTDLFKGSKGEGVQENEQ